MVDGRVKTIRLVTACRCSRIIEIAEEYFPEKWIVVLPEPNPSVGHEQLELFGSEYKHLLRHRVFEREITMENIMRITPIYNEVLGK